MPFGLAPGTTAYLIYTILVWSARFGFIAYVLPKHRPSVSIAWIAVTLVHPALGIPLYLFFGRPVMGRAGVKAHERAKEVVARLRTESAPPNRFDRIEPDHRDLARLAESLGGHRLQLGNHVEILPSATTYIDALVRAIDEAESSVHLLYYIYLVDEVSRRVTHALIRAAERGVATRVLVDAVGSKEFLERVAPDLRKAGAEVRAALPVRVVRGKFARFDVRNHRKIAVIDNAVAITGSHNLCDPSYGKVHFGPWMDLSLRITGPVVEELQRVFLQDWVAEGADPPDLPPPPAPDPGIDPGVPVLVAPAGPGHGNQAFRDLIVSAINEANERVVLTTPYFVPDEPALLALRLRAMAGLDVRLVVPEKTNSALVNAASRPALQFAMEAGVKVHLHQEGLLHAKVVTIDDAFAVVGSGNFDRRSFDLNYEVNLVVFGKKITSALRATQHAYIEKSRPLDIAEIRDRSYPRRVVDAAINVMAPLL